MVIANDERYLELLRDQSEFSLESGEASEEATALDEVMKKTLAVVRSVQRQGGLPWRKHRGAEFPLLQADPDKVKQKFIHLINNALEAMAHGGALGVKTSISRGRAESAGRDPHIW